MNKEKAQKLIEDYLSNKISKQELREFLKGFEDEEIMKEYEKVIKVHFESIADRNSINPKNYDEKIREAQEIISRSEKTEHLGKSRTLNWLYKIAASVALIAAVYFAYDFIGEGRPSLLQNKIETYIPPGQKQNIKLSDGTMAHLNSSTQLTYPKNFSKDVRLVELEGEAFFDVKRDTLKPFVIQTAQMAIKVLGTSFNVSAYSEESNTVSVISGKVQVTIGSEEHILTKNQKIIFQKSGKVEFLEMNTLSDISWTKGILQFESTPFEQVEKRLERWYNVEIEVKDSSIYNKRISGQHTKESIQEIMDSFSYMMDLSYSIENDKIIIKEKKL